MPISNELRESTSEGGLTQGGQDGKLRGSARGGELTYINGPDPSGRGLLVPEAGAFITSGPPADYVPGRSVPKVVGVPADQSHGNGRVVLPVKPKPAKMEPDPMLNRKVAMIPEPPRDAASMLHHALRSARDRYHDHDYAGALGWADNVLRLDPNNLMARALRAQVLNRLGRYGEAEFEAMQALKLDPRNRRALRALSWAQLKQGKYAMARESATRTIQTYPQEPIHYVIRANAAYRGGDRQAALSDMQAAAEIDERFKDQLDLVLGGGDVEADDDDSQFVERFAKSKKAPAAPLRRQLPLAAGLLGLGISAGFAWGLYWRGWGSRRAGFLGGKRDQRPSGSTSGRQIAMR
ncbi:MAG: tetratricopeptide repeat protein [Elusimicrobia bacterium]|nr:tetratricopeptide repeat protein [Elusimicrobiota bacterium]